MNGKGSRSELARRLFLTRLGAGVGVVGAATVGAPASHAQSSEATGWKPTRHALDDWMDKLPGQHRFVFDTITPEGIAQTLQFANNFFEANKTGYELQDSDLAVIVVCRHKSTAFAYKDSIWAKYSAQLSTQTGFVDPKTKEAPVINVYGTPGNGSDQQAGRLNNLIKRGTHLAVCQMATRAIAGQIARATNQTQDAVLAELISNLLDNAHMAPAGIVAVNRAQERGYTFANGG